MVQTQRVSEEKRTEFLHERVQEKLSTLVTSIVTSCGDLEVSLAATRDSFDTFRDLFRIARLDADLSFEMLVSCTAIDHLDSRPVRFDVVYHLLSLKHLHRLRVIVGVDERLSEVPSLTSLWKSADWMEREVFDMYGIRFEGHPDLRRILMYDGFDGHPLRKDFPVQGKQPRVPMLSPEVRNTAMDLTRAPLVGINPRRKSASEKSSEDSGRGTL